MKPLSVRTTVLLLCALLTIGGAAGCAKLFKKSYPDKTFYALDLSEATPGLPPRVPSPLGEALKVRSLRIADMYRGQEFVLRMGDVDFRTDFYNAFLVSPAQNVTDVVRDWMRRSGLFSVVLDAASRVPAMYTLEGTVVSLYADRRDPKQTVAVLELQLVLVREDDSGTTVAFEASYAERQALPSYTPEDLARAWSDSLSRIMQRFGADVQAKLGTAQE